MTDPILLKITSHLPLFSPLLLNSLFDRLGDLPRSFLKDVYADGVLLVSWPVLSRVVAETQSHNENKSCSYHDSNVWWICNRKCHSTINFFRMYIWMNECMNWSILYILQIEFFSLIHCCSLLFSVIHFIYFESVGEMQKINQRYLRREEY